MFILNVNGKIHNVDVPKDTPLLWVLRDDLKLMGTKYSCGIGECGACTVHVDGKAEKSCTITVADAHGKKIITIEGIPDSHPVKRAWIKEQVVQCGFCQPGVMMQVAASLSEKPTPDAEKVISQMDDVICRCGTYLRMKKGIKTARSDDEKGGREIMNTTISRRSFLKGSLASTGLTIAVSVSPLGIRLLNASQAKEALKNFKPNLWYEITPNNVVNVFLGASEMGQGTHTALSMIIADELEADWKQVRVRQGGAAKEYHNPLLGEQLTVASATVRGFYEPCRKAAAAGRAVLVKAAATSWGVPEDECEAIKGHRDAQKELAKKHLRPALP